MMEHINLVGADLSSTDMSHLDLNYADLTGADLTGADLTGSLLAGANLIGADLSGATLANTTFQWANLYLAITTEVELQRLEQLAASGALIGAIMPDGSRPYPVPEEAEAEIWKHPESELAQRERELGRIARLLEQQKQQAGPR
jgi:hypothetical protein